MTSQKGSGVGFAIEPHCDVHCDCQDAGKEKFRDNLGQQIDCVRGSESCIHSK